MRVLTLGFVLTLAAACSAPAPAAAPARPGAAKSDDASTVLLGGTSYCPDSAPYDAFDQVAYTRSLGRYQALSFQASAGDQPDVAIAAAAATPGARPRAWLEDDAGNVVLSNANDDDAPGFDLEASSLARGGLYYLIFDNKLDADATFSLRIDCTQGDCAATHACGVALPLAP